MRADKLSEAFDKISDRFIIEAEEYGISEDEVVPVTEKKIKPFIYLIPAAAAAIALFVAAETFRKPLDNGFETVNNETEASYSETDPVTEHDALVNTGSESSGYITAGSTVSTVPVTEIPIILSTVSGANFTTVISKADDPDVSETTVRTDKPSDAAITTVSQEAMNTVPTSVASSSEVPEEITCISTEKITSSVPKTDDPTCTDGTEYAPPIQTIKPQDPPSGGDPNYDHERENRDLLTDENGNRYYIIRRMNEQEKESIEESHGNYILENEFGYPVKGEIFSIKGISNSYAVILKTNNTYTAYRTDRAGGVLTAGELFDDTDLRSSEAKSFKISERLMNVDKYDKRLLTDMIFNGNEDSEILYSIDKGKSMYKATLSYEHIKSDVNVEIFDNGYIYIKILGQEYYYKNNNINEMKNIYDGYI